MLELVFKYILKNNYQSYDIPFWFEAHCICFLCFDTLLIPA